MTSLRSRFTTFLLASDGIWKAAGLLLCAKALYFAGMLVALSLGGEIELAVFRSILHWPPSDKPFFSYHFSTWDASHYLKLSDVGYIPGAPSNAFYPLWPMLIRAAGAFFPADALLRALLLANLLSIAAGVLMMRAAPASLPLAPQGSRVWLWSVVLLFSFPGSLFYQFPYTESLFLLLLLGCFIACRQGKALLASACAFALPLTRPVGVFVVAPLVVEVCLPFVGPALMCRSQSLGRLGQRISGFFGCNQTAEAAPSRMRPASAAFLTLSPLFGWLAYFAFMRSAAGNPFEGFEAQKFWGVNSVSHLLHPLRTFETFCNPSAWHDYEGSVLDRLVFVFVLGTLPLVWRCDRRLAVWTVAIGILPGILSTFVSYTRYSSVAFPVFIALALHFQKSRFRYVLLTAFTVLHGFLLWRHINLRWAG